MHCQPSLKELVYNWLNNNQSCLLCDEPAQQPRPICSACESELPWLDECCQTCALPLPMRDLTCGQCSRRPPAFTRVEAPWHYGFPVDALITRFKHQRQWPLGRLLAQLLGCWLAHRFADGLPRPALLLPVPMARRRLRERGFNQAGMLAQWLAGQLGIACAADILQRPHDTLAQQGLTANARRGNLLRAFALSDSAAIHGLHVAIVDDVLTTGATAQALASLLRQAGAQRVDVYCLARTPKPGSA
ncbi:ComF family protein [Pseudomonas sp. MAFF212428]|uniref:ComF family protein n=1 Tax=Pseudomonas brassicae TaxID=2708063 RepID=A0A6B3NRW3_9PSED|nr:ComF family protein [Pseudomonas brassicae]NER60526.1 ComF family protein [Pseudomonas brassicae]NER63158.1 ComF family protein [Pseudomonas brassicae]